MIVTGKIVQVMNGTVILLKISWPIGRRKSLINMKTRIINLNIISSYSKKMAMFAVTVLLFSTSCLIADQTPLSAFKWHMGESGGVIITGYNGPGGTVIIPKQINGVPVISIGVLAFSYWQLTSVTIPNSVITIEYMAFANNQLTSVIIPNSVTTIGGGAFQGNQLTSVIIPNNVTSIGEEAFSDNHLSSVTIGYNVNSIGYMAFAHNQLSSITIPYSVTSIGDWVFLSNVNLQGITVSKCNTHFVSIDGVLFNANKTKLILFPPGRAGSYTIPASVNYIGTGAFVPNSLTNIVIGANVKFGNFALEYSFEAAYINNGRVAGTYTRPHANSWDWACN